MSQSGRARRLVANLFIALGVVVLLIVGGNFGWQAIRGRQLRAALQPTPVATALNPTVTLAPPTASPPTAPPTLLPAPSASPSSAPIPSPAPIVVTAVVPSPTPTRLAPSATPPPTITPAPAPAAVAGGSPARIVIAAPINIDAPVVEMGWEVVQTASGPQSEWVIPKNEAGHHINSAQLGERGNIVISGHNNIHGKVFEAISLAWDDTKRQRVDDFTDSSEILDGRPIQLYDAAGQRFDFTITDFYRLKDTGVSLEQRIANGRFMAPTDDARLTLVTCWPIWSNTHRLIVVAQPVKQP